MSEMPARADARHSQLDWYRFRSRRRARARPDCRSNLLYNLGDLGFAGLRTSIVNAVPPAFRVITS